MTKKSEKYVMVCPKCGGIDISSDLDKLGRTGTLGYRCNDCDFTAPVFPEMIESEVSIFKEQLKTKREKPLEKSEERRNWFWLFQLDSYIIIFLALFVVYQGITFKNNSLLIIGILITIFSVINLYPDKRRN